MNRTRKRVAADIGGPKLFIGDKPALRDAGAGGGE